MDPMDPQVWLRFACYGLLGWGAEILWTGVKPLRRRPIDWRLPGDTSLWMFPIYGLSAFLFEPIHELLRVCAWPARAAAYVAGIWIIEYLTSWLIERAVGSPPWDYSYARWNLHGRIRWDYAPLWVLFGLLLERVHDALLRAGPTLLGT